MSTSSIPWPRPVEVALTEPFWSASREHVLAVQRCSECRRFRHPPTLMCPHCGSMEFRSEQVAGTGAVYTFLIQEKPEPSDLPHPWPADEFPVVIVVIELDGTDGVCLMSMLEGVAVADVVIGMRVTVGFREVAPGLVLPVFGPEQVELE